MKTTLTWAVVISGLIFAGAPAGAQEFWFVPHFDEARTPIEAELSGPDLALPGFGIASTRAAIIKRLEYALDHKWLTAAQDQQFCNDLKTITDREQSLRDAGGNLSYRNRVELARQLADLNNKFEELVLAREQSSPGIAGLLARQAMMIERVNQGVAGGKISARRAAQAKAEIKAIAAEVPDKDLSDEQAKKIAYELTRINRELDVDLRGPSISTRQLPFSR